MTSSSNQSALILASLIAFSFPVHAIKTETMVAIRNDVMIEQTVAASASHANLESKAGAKSLSGHEGDALEVAKALQSATKQRFAGFVQGSLLLVALAALGLYAVRNQSGKKAQQAKIAEYAVKSDVAPAEAPSPSVAEIEEDLDRYLSKEAEDIDGDLNDADKMLEDSLDAEAEAVFLQKRGEDELVESRTELEVAEQLSEALVSSLAQANSTSVVEIEQDLDRYLTKEMEDLDSGADKMLEDSLDAEAEALYLQKRGEEKDEVEESRMEAEVAEQLSEALVSSLAEANSPAVAQIEQELHRYLTKDMEDLDADLNDGLDKMLETSLDAEVEAFHFQHKLEEEDEVDVSRIEAEIAEQFSEALGFSQVPAWIY